MSLGEMDELAEKVSVWFQADAFSGTEEMKAPGATGGGNTVEVGRRARDEDVDLDSLLMRDADAQGTWVVR
jgi:hypothetical protein